MLQLPHQHYNSLEIGIDVLIIKFLDLESIHKLSHQKLNKLQPTYIIQVIVYILIREDIT